MTERISERGQWLIADVESVAALFRHAIYQVAYELGGAELQGNVSEVDNPSDGPWPNPLVLEVLKNACPEVSDLDELIGIKMEELMRQSEAADREVERRSRLRRLGGAFLQGIEIIATFGRTAANHKRS